MNIDDLSKSQLLLLTLLVNFVMSIATGIVTVSLLDQAPATITQTVNRIVEHTVETVAPASQVAAVVSSDPQPTEEDLLVAAIASDAARTVFIHAEEGETQVLAQGVYLPISRVVVVIKDSSLPKEAAVSFPNGTVAPVSIALENDNLTIYGFGDGAALPSAPVAPLLPLENLKQGQAVIALLADGSAVTGIVSKVEGINVTTTLPATPKGAAALTLRGEIAGIQSGSGAFISASEINALLSTPQ